MGAGQSRVEPSEQDEDVDTNIQVNFVVISISVSKSYGYIFLCVVYWHFNQHALCRMYTAYTYIEHKHGFYLTIIYTILGGFYNSYDI